MNQPRRIFLMTMTASAGAFVSGTHAQAKPDEKDPVVVLGYVAEAAKADVKRFPKYAAGQNCATCTLYQAKAGDAAGGCPLFGTKQVAAKGWCSAWIKKG